MGLGLFSDNLLKKVKLESKLGFAYSLELLGKCERLRLKIDEVPFQNGKKELEGKRLKIFKWLAQYLKWYLWTGHLLA